PIHSAAHRVVDGDEEGIVERILRPWIDRRYFFSGGRRHTRWPRDWSSDVCSSDLDGYFQGEVYPDGPFRGAGMIQRGSVMDMPRSEERRVGKEWKCGWSTNQ